jgi:hypothetical protein
MDKGRKGYYDAKAGRIRHSVDCTCPLHRRKFNILRKDEKEQLKKDKLIKRLDKRFGVLQDVPLFCRVFPEGIVGDCGFFFYGFCRVFEDGCVRWNELGDKMDYSVGGKNSFLR